MHRSLGDDVGIESIAEVNGVDVVTGSTQLAFSKSTHLEAHLSKAAKDLSTYHSKSLYMMVKKTCKNRLTALINTDRRNNQASPDIMMAVMCKGGGYGSEA